ncbi:MAG: ammonium transporter [Cyanobacteriota bacterium]|nr:ammonium transporter [Cyanobacteriota bacterium]
MGRKSRLVTILFLVTLGLVLLVPSPLAPQKMSRSSDRFISQIENNSTQLQRRTPKFKTVEAGFHKTIVPPPEMFQFFQERADNPQSAIAKQDENRFGEQFGRETYPTYEVIDILWLLVCSGLVFIMQAGFMCLESGLTRSKNSINVAIKNLTDFGISVTLFWAFGFAFMFGASYKGWIGLTGFFLPTELEPFLAAFFFFQAMFCGTATTIVSGAVAERVKFSSYIAVASLLSGIIYPIFGHWAWNGAQIGNFAGWLGKLGFVDFAGSTVVHSVGGWVSLAILLVVGPRAGRFPKNGPPQKIHGSNIPLSVLGAMLLWFGWFGFNGGSTLALNGQVASIIVNTVLAGVAGMIVTLAVGWSRKHIPDVDFLINGALAGLVAITAGCHAVSGGAALAIGGIGGLVMMLVEATLERLRIDDAVGAIPVHLGAGVWGTLAVALFGQPELLGTGLSAIAQFEVQLLGVVAAFGISFGLAYPVLLIANKFYSLRVSPADEDIGLNVSEHRAKTEILDLFKVMDSQAKTQDLSLRVPVEPFTEVGQIAERYNEVMDALEEEVTRTEAVVNTATDAIITFTKPGLEIINVNPSAEKIFGYAREDLLGINIEKIIALELSNLTGDGTSLISETHSNTDWQKLKLWVDPELINTQDLPLFRFTYFYRFASPSNIETPDWQGQFPDFLAIKNEAKQRQNKANITKKKRKPKSPREVLIARLVEGGTSDEVIGIRVDGSVFPMEVSIKEVRSHHGFFYTGMFRDITERKQAEIAIKESEERFRSLSGATLEGIIVRDRGKIADANQAAAKMFGWEVSDLIGIDGMNLIAPEAREIVSQHIASNSEKPLEALGLRKDGSTFPIEMEARVFDARGRKLRVTAIRDISDRKRSQAALRESEERFRSVMQQAADAFILHDLKGKIIDANQSACSSLGYTREELLKLSIGDIENDFFSQGIWQQWQQMVPGEPITIEGIQRRKDGTTFPVEVRLGLLEAGNRKLFLALCRDITDRKRSEEALRLEQEKSEKLLLNILPEAIATRLKENESNIAEGFAEVTVLFADIVGFTKLASRKSPRELVMLLDEIFSSFDELAEKHGLEKIKTIGDAYMVVGGLPVPLANHGEAIADMALDMQREVTRFSQIWGERTSIRIGINTGPVVAGVIGRKKFIYDLWGDTVNVASRMESHGVAGEIQVTQATYEILKDKFLFVQRGAIDVKGKGKMKTFLLKGKVVEIINN